MLGCTASDEQHRQQREPDAAEEVVAAEQQPGVDAVGEPAGADRADDVEDADDREQPGRGGLLHAVVVRGRHEVGADQPVGGRAADREAGDERPEGAAVRGDAQRVDRGAGGVGPCDERDLVLLDDADLLGGRGRGSAVRLDAEVGRPVAQEHQHERDDGEGGRRDDQRRDAPPGALRDDRDHRQEHQLPGRAARR